MKYRRSAMVSAHLVERRIDRNAREAFTNSLHDLIKKNKCTHGLTNREDTYVSVRELLNNYHFRMLTFPTLQKVVNQDRLHRFELLYQPLKGRDGDSWWIRVKRREEKDLRIDPIIFSDNVGPAIYGATLQDWRSYISLKGISRRDNDYIQISRGVPTQDYFTSLGPITTQVLIHVDVKRAIDMGIRFFLSSRPSPFFAPPMPSLPHNRLASPSSSNSPSQTTRLGRQNHAPLRANSPSATSYIHRSTQILTPGNDFGFLPPEYFTRVEVVRVKHKVLWTLDDEAGVAVE
ncbi:hypothetical protein BYT27DRAFT_7251367 [Phlegmacium glaucopus]|nr:hypothetical protein BYT27DRAFT_7251367 [Phlegmacium glaucopus]